MRIGRWIVVLGVAVAVGVAAWLTLGRESRAESYVTMPVRRGPIAAVVTATGTVNPVITVTVGSQVSGQVKSLHADFNSIVGRGEVIARLDPSNLEGEVSRTRANLSSALANLERARVEADNARRNSERAKSLRAQKLISEVDYDAAESAAAAASASVRTAEAAVEQSRALLRIAEINLAHATIISPVDGIVISRDVDVGQTVAASLQAPTLFTIAQDLREMEVYMNVAESDIGRLSVGQEASFTVDAYPQERFSGTISEIRNSPTTIQNVVTYEAVIGVNNEDLRLKPGMTANISVVVAQREDALLVPNAALRFKPPERLRAQEKGPSGAEGPPARAGRLEGTAEPSRSPEQSPSPDGVARRTGEGGRASDAGRDRRPGRGDGRGEGGMGGPGPRQSQTGEGASKSASDVAGSDTEGREGGARAEAGGNVERTSDAGAEAAGSGDPLRGPSASKGRRGGRDGADARGGPRGGFAETGSPEKSEPSASPADGSRRAWAAGGGSAPGGSPPRGGRPGPVVWVLEGKNPKRVAISIGITDGSWTEVVSGEIAEGDPVVTEMSGAGAPQRASRPGFGRMF